MSYCKTVFNQDQEMELVEHVFVMENRFFWADAVRGLAFELAERKEISHYFNNPKKMAG
jgi:hypothetical protein